MEYDGKYENGNPPYTFYQRPDPMIRNPDVTEDMKITMYRAKAGLNDTVRCFEEKSGESPDKDA